MAHVLVTPFVEVDFMSLISPQLQPCYCYESSNLSLEKNLSSHPSVPYAINGDHALLQALDHNTKEERFFFVVDEER